MANRIALLARSMQRSTGPLAKICGVAAAAVMICFGQSCKSKAIAYNDCTAATRSCPFIASLLAQREGYGRNATGGLDGAIVTVTSAADSGPGSLRDVVGRAHGPTWVRFDRDLIIEAQSQIRVRSDVTIDGRGHLVTVVGHGFSVANASNIILTHLTVDGRNQDGVGGRSFGQAVNVSVGASNIWLDHLDLSRFNDRLVDVKHGATDVTLSWIKFHDDNKVMLLYNFSKDPDNPGNIFENFEQNPLSRVTLHHNYFVNTVQRNPRVAGYGAYHIYNNLLEAWDFYGMSFSLEARAVVEGNIFDNVSARSCLEPPSFWTIEHAERNYCGAIPNAGQMAAMANGQADKGQYDRSNPTYHYTHDWRAFLIVRDNLALHDARLTLTSYKPEEVSSPPYCYSYQAPSAALEDEIRQKAGNTPFDTVLPQTRCPK